MLIIKDKLCDQYYHYFDADKYKPKLGTKNHAIKFKKRSTAEMVIKQLKLAAPSREFIITDDSDGGE